MVYLLLPSLEEKRHIRIEELSLNEAKEFIAAFETRVVAERKLNPAPGGQTPVVDAFIEYNLLQNLEDMDLDELADELVESKIPKARGIRAVAIDTDTDTILVGTSVVYSKNWAITGFEDPTIPVTLLSFDD